MEETEFLNYNFFENRKNKSFRPRERPKKGLKNLQSVKTLSAGQNLINNQTAVKTRKQPLTVAAQFHNSLIALMETLNQVCCEHAREGEKNFPRDDGNFPHMIDFLNFHSLSLSIFLTQANPFFIRCIKSNPNKISNQFDDATVTRQVREIILSHFWDQPIHVLFIK
jgi:hypothetical protein